MTSRSLKKRRITALMGRLATRRDGLKTTLTRSATTAVVTTAILVASPFAATSHAQNAFERARQNTSHTHNAYRTGVAPTAADAQTPGQVVTTPSRHANNVNHTNHVAAQPAGWNLRWRKSSQITPEPVHIPRQDVFTNAPIPSSPQANEQVVSQSNPQVVSQANWRQPADAGSQAAFQNPALQNAAFQKPVRTVGHDQPIAHADSHAIPAQARREADAFFRNPFADAAMSGSKRVAVAPTEPRPAPRAAATPLPTQLTNQQGGDVGSLFDEIPAPAEQVLPNALRQNASGENAAAGMQLPSGDSSLMLPPSSDAAFPSENPDANLVQPGGETSAMPVPSNDTPAAGAPAADAPGADSGPSLGDVMRQSGEDTDLSSPQSSPQSLRDELRSDAQPSDGEMETLPNGAGTTEGADTQSRESNQDSPSDRDLFDSSAFGTDADRADRDQLNQQADSAGDDSESDDTSANVGVLSASQLSCDDFRSRIAEETIDKLTLDISPPFRPDIFDPKKYAREREKFDSRQSSRQWYSVDGRPLGTGRLVDLKYEQVVIESEYGAQETIQIGDLSEGDLGFLSENWGLPRECRVEQVAFTPRNWTPATITWKASNLCHKPKYFEEVNLERYGHTAGPVLQPIVSSAHFFANIAVLPYKMGVHSPDECQYALGYYRPGNCAPWIVPPVPISAKGALAQGAAMSGLFWLIP